MKPNRLLLALLLTFAATTIYGRDAYVVQGFSRGAPYNRLTTVWSTDALFYNGTSTDAQVTVLGGSAEIGTAGLIGQSIFVAAGHTASLQRQLRIPAVPLAMLHLDVPDGVIVHNVLYVGSEPPTALSPDIEFRTYGTIQLPVFTALVPPNEQQVRLETDNGDIPTHINVGIYNAGLATATATIVVRSHCDDSAVTTRTVTVPPATVIQAGPFAAATQCANPELRQSVYTVVTVDQPSLTFVSALANDNAPTTSITISGN